MDQTNITACLQENKKENKNFKKRVKMLEYIKTVLWLSQFYLPRIKSQHRKTYLYEEQQR